MSEELILHHYPTSPFAEKIRAILGAKKLPWRSVIIPRILPKPDVIALTGGYRKTPILQIGADVYCDTTRIAQRLDELAPEPALYPPAHAASAARLAQWSDNTFFHIAVALMFQPSALSQTFASDPQQMQAFIQDRMAMRKGATLRRVPADEAKAALAVFSRELEAQLADRRPYLLGDAPTIADFSIYHPFWFIRRNPALQLDAHPLLGRWLARMEALGHGESSELASADALAIARNAKPRAPAPRCDVEGFAPGDRVEVVPTDYGLDASAGELLACTPDEIAIRRSDPRAGELIVHFPRWTYELRKPA
jgi:glutathione S-transferase